MYEDELDEHWRTERDLHEALLRESALLARKDELIRQKNVLSSELEHRLLNGLQMITSLLVLQSRSTKNAEAAAQLAIPLGFIACELITNSLKYAKGKDRRWPSSRPSGVALYRYPTTALAYLLTPDQIIISPSVPISAYRDDFGNSGTRILAAPGRMRISTDALVQDAGLPDPVVTDAPQVPVQQPIIWQHVARLAACTGDL